MIKKINLLTIIVLLTLTSCGPQPGSSSGNTSGAGNTGSSGNTSSTCTATQIKMANKCVEKTAKLDAFMAQDVTFINEMTERTDVWGSTHGEVPDWTKICQSSSTLVYMDSAVTGLALMFKKNSDDVWLVIRNSGSNADVKYDFKYSGTTLANGALLIKLDANGQSVMGKISYGRGDPVPPDTNHLEFFTKVNWFVDPTQVQLKGASLLIYIGYRKTEPEVMFNTEKDIDDGISYIKEEIRKGTSTAGFDIEVNGVKSDGITFVFGKHTP